LQSAKKFRRAARLSIAVLGDCLRRGGDRNRYGDGYREAGELYFAHRRGQDEGAAVFGIGQTFFEDLVYENGELMNGSLIDYRLPRFSDVPANFKTIILEEGGGRGPYGAKGMGEGGILAVAPAVCNAVENAIGVRM